MQQARVRRTACMQNLRVEVAKVQTLPATLKRSRHPRGTKIVAQSLPRRGVIVRKMFRLCVARFVDYMVQPHDLTVAGMCNGQTSLAPYLVSAEPPHQPPRQPPHQPPHQSALSAMPNSACVRASVLSARRQSLAPPASHRQPRTASLAPPTTPTQSRRQSRSPHLAPCTAHHLSRSRPISADSRPISANTQPQLVHAAFTTLALLRDLAPPPSSGHETSLSHAPVEVGAPSPWRLCFP